MINDTNYILIPGFAVSKLNLKGLSLMIYSIIYGFSQGNNGCYNGSLKYLEDWTNTTRQAVIKSLNMLLNDNLILKEKSFPNNIYRVNVEKLNELNCKQYLHNCKNNLIGDSKLNLQNNINNINNINNNINNISQSLLEKTDNYIKEKELHSQINDIISYLNDVCSTKFKATSSSAKKTIKARLKEGYKFDDFKDVIDFKWKEWGEAPVKFSTGQMSNTYLRPSTLFGSKFDEYLQAAWLKQFNKDKQINIESNKKFDERSNLEF